MEVARHFKDKVMFSLSRVDDYKHELEHFNLISEDEVVDPDKMFVAAWDKDGQKFAMREEFSLTAFKDWTKKFVEGELDPFLKSQNAPSDDEKFEDGIKVVVANTWQDEVIQQDSKDILVTFFAPWCSHCKMLMPVLSKLAANLKVQ